MVVEQKIIKIQSSGHLRYDRFKQNLKCNNFIHSMIEALYNNIEEFFDKFMSL